MSAPEGRTERSNKFGPEGRTERFKLNQALVHHRIGDLLEAGDVRARLT